MNEKEMIERIKKLERVKEAIERLPFGSSQALPWCIESFPELCKALEEANK